MGLLLALLIATGAIGFALYHTTARGRQVTLVTLWLYLVVVLWLILAPGLPLNLGPHPLHDMMFGHIHINLWPFQAVDLQFWLNVLMTIPAGIYYGLLTRERRPYRFIGVCMLIGLSTELAQFSVDILFHQQRTIDIDDVITNFLGALLGYALLQLLARWPYTARLVQWFQGDQSALN